jgi:DNA-binding transcriptional MerR regulator
MSKLNLTFETVRLDTQDTAALGGVSAENIREWRQVLIFPEARRRRHPGARALYGPVDFLCLAIVSRALAANMRLREIQVFIDALAPRFELLADFGKAPIEVLAASFKGIEAVGYRSAGGEYWVDVYAGGVSERRGVDDPLCGYWIDLGRLAERVVVMVRAFFEAREAMEPADEEAGAAE